MISEKGVHIEPLSNKHGDRCMNVRRACVGWKFHFRNFAIPMNGTAYEVYIQWQFMWLWHIYNLFFGLIKSNAINGRSNLWISSQWYAIEYLVLQCLYWNLKHTYITKVESGIMQWVVIDNSECWYPHYVAASYANLLRFSFCLIDRWWSKNQHLMLMYVTKIWKNCDSHGIHQSIAAVTNNI